MKVLIIEDNCDIREFLVRNFLSSQNIVEIASNREEALRKIDKSFDVIIMDWMLGLDDGVKLVSEIRKQYDTPIIMLTVRSDHEDIVRAFDVGVDDFMSKPFSLNELNARVDNLVKRKARLNFKDTKISAGDLTLDLKRHVVKNGDKEIDLTKTEYQLLECLMLNKNSLMSRGDIEAIICNYGEKSGNLLNMHILNLRKKIGNKAIIKTIPMKGFVFIE